MKHYCKYTQLEESISSLELEIQPADSEPSPFWFISGINNFQFGSYGNTSSNQRYTCLTLQLAMKNCHTHIPSKKPGNGGKEKIKVKFCLNLHGIVTVDSKTLSEEEEIEVPVTKESAEEDSE
ncbi:hypothetical protein KIW84_070778 [Lathyrus oleraceus]|uniref:Uncharacterized protein n=1 Tax=Pisum sativum TaxID=3888 RepID=A0A9D4VHQ0_PEA|nr:hypothetical protein KIW84_070778 [Pisum sativum]